MGGEFGSTTELRQPHLQNLDSATNENRLNYLMINEEKIALSEDTKIKRAIVCPSAALLSP